MVVPKQGLHLDGHPSEQPEGTWRFGKNAVFDEKTASVTNEKGTKFLYDLVNITGFPSEYDSISYLGGLSLNNEQSVAFIQYIIEESPVNFIALIENHTATVILQDIIQQPFLNFNPLYKIKGTYKINEKGERVIYWTDNYNPPRFLNVDNPKSQGDIRFGLDTINIFPEQDIPIIEVSSVNLSGGNLDTGSYQFFVQYETEEGYQSSWYGNTIPVPVTLSHESLDNIHGGEPGVPTSKSISLEVSNIDFRFHRMRIAVGKNIEEVRSFAVINEFLITEDTYTFTYTGTDIQSLSDAEISTRAVSYTTARDIHQYNNVLMWSSLTRDELIDYQQIANNINVRWNLSSQHDLYTYEEGFLDLNFKDKQPLRDEVYALCVFFELKNGQITEGFHIPGREKEEYDEELVQGSDPDNWRGETVEKWKVHNTAQPGGKMGYWESSLRYPDNEMWGDLAGQPIRHHKMPDFSVSLPFYGRHKELKLRFDNVVIPTEHQDNIKAIHFGYAPRDTIEKRSVIAKGYIYNTVDSLEENVDIRNINYFEPDQSDEPSAFYSFHSPDTSFRRGQVDINGDYVKVEAIARDDDPEELDNWTASSASSGFAHYLRQRLELAPREDQQYAAIKTAKYISNNTREVVDGEIINNDHGPSTVVFRLQRPLAPNLDIFDSNFHDPFEPAHVHVRYASMKRDLPNQYGSIENLYYVYGGQSIYRPTDGWNTHSFAINNVLNVPPILIGDSVFSRFTYKVYQITPGGEKGEIDDTRYILVDNYAESEINSAFRTSGYLGEDSEHRTFWPYAQEELGLSKLQFLSHRNNGVGRPWNNNYFEYNEDYSALPDTYTIAQDTERGGISKFPNRVIYTIEPEGTITDGYLNYAPADFIEIPRKNGELFFITSYQNTLYAITENSVYRIMVQPQEMETTQDSVFLRTADMFQIAPVEMTPGFAGSRDVTYNSNKFGVFYPDTRQGKILNLENQEDMEISNKGVREFFKNFGRYYIKDLEKDFPIDTYYHPHGAGVEIIFDTQNDRILIFKKDKTLSDINKDLYKGVYDSQETYNIGDIVLDIEGDIVTPLGFASVASMDNGNPVWIEISGQDRSYTISYYPKYQMWGFFHDYIPDLVIATYDKVYMALESEIYKLNEGNYGEYFLQQYPTVFETIDNREAVHNKLLKFIELNTRVFKDANELKETFHRYILYNDYQCSGLKNFDPSKTMKTWTLPAPFDLSIDEERFFLDLPNRQFNTSSVDTGKSWYNRRRFRDNYVGMRFEFDNTENKLLQILYIIAHSLKDRR